MRTVTLLGLVAIADAINKNWFTSNKTVAVYGIVLIVSMLMDVWDFLKNDKDK